MEGMIWRNVTLIVCNITDWKDVKRWLNVSVIARLCKCCCSVIFYLNDVSMSALNLFFPLDFKEVIVVERGYYCLFYIWQRYSSNDCIWIHIIAFWRSVHVFVLKNGKIIFIFNIIWSSDMTFHCVLWSIVELYCCRGGFFLKNGCVYDKGCINIVVVGTPRIFDLKL